MQTKIKKRRENIRVVIISDKRNFVLIWGRMLQEAKISQAFFRAYQRLQVPLLKPHWVKMHQIMTRTVRVREDLITQSTYLILLPIYYFTFILFYFILYCSPIECYSYGIGNTITAINQHLARFFSFKKLLTRN